MRFKVEKEPRVERDEARLPYAEDSDESDISSDEEDEDENQERLTEETLRMIAEFIKSRKDKHELYIDCSL